MSLKHIVSGGNCPIYAPIHGHLSPCAGLLRPGQVPKGVSPMNPSYVGTPRSPRNGRLHKIALFSRAFRRNEDGGLIIFSMMMFVLMLLIAGMSLDIERFETARTKLQNTADSAALAAASLTQTVPSQEIVNDYFAKADMGDFIEDVHVTSALNYKNVVVEADINVPTHFFNMIGINNLATLVDSTAEESIGDVEISLVLDVSGSMGSNSKLSNLKTAANDFIDAIYEDTADGSVSISIVPYSTQVSVGPDILSHFTDRDVEHDYSHCINWESGDFSSVAIDFDAPVEQTLHLDARTDDNWGWSANNDLWYRECPDYGWTDILVMSENITQLKNYINAFSATDWTSIELGVKWGAALLDPSFQPVVADLVASGDADADFADRPMSYEEADGLKVLVVMTDGQNTDQYSMNEPYRTGQSDTYVFYDQWDRPYYSIWGGDGEPVTTVQYETVIETESVCIDWRYVYRKGRWRWRCYDWETTYTEVERPVMNWYLANDYSSDGVSDGWRSTPYGGENATRMTWAQLWAEVPVYVFTDDYLRNMGGQTTQRDAIEAAVDYADISTKDPNTLSICSAAKANGVLIYAIGFEAPVNSELLLESCATTPSHFFDVDGAEISQAFSAIAADINRLRLIQ